eukprot:RCo028851
MHKFFGQQVWLWRRLLLGKPSAQPSCRGFSTHFQKLPDSEVDLNRFPPDKVRNFCIVAHIDHGKTTLSDALLKTTGVLPQDGTDKLYLDKLQVEKERGITVKAQTASMTHDWKGEKYLLNLIDTPGHVDFSYEVGRSMMACEGALLLVDASQGIQAQTQANMELAVRFKLVLIPVITKIDAPHAEVEGVMDQVELHDLMNVRRNDILLTSAKKMEGISAVLDAICERIPAPSGSPGGQAKALLFDAWFTAARIMLLVCVKQGAFRKGDVVMSYATKQKYTISNIGIMHPEPTNTGRLLCGQVGYIEMGMSRKKDALVGDTFFLPAQMDYSKVEPFPGFRMPNPTVFASIYPAGSSTVAELREAVEKLSCNDPSVTCAPEGSDALGQGLRCGFLGLLHMSIFTERLLQEFGTSVVITPPSVAFRGIRQDGSPLMIERASEWVDFPKVKEHQEPLVDMTIFVPQRYSGAVLSLCQEHRGRLNETTYPAADTVCFKLTMPFLEIVRRFPHELRAATNGFASMEYKEVGFVKSDLVKVDLLLNGRIIDCLSQITHRDYAVDLARSYVQKIKSVMRRQLVDVHIQGVVRGKVVAREGLKALRNDVTAKCYGGDITRKMKLLDGQKKGKKALQKSMQLELPKEVFSEIMKLD